MKTPAPPPDYAGLRSEFRRQTSEPAKRARQGKDVSHAFRLIDLSLTQLADDYAPWDKVRYRTPPHGLDHDTWWFLLRRQRNSVARHLPLNDIAGKSFSYALPDPVLQMCDAVSRRAGGSIGTPEPVVNSATRDSYLVRSLMEEAISSSQLEGAATTRPVAKEMLRTGRAPRDRSEQMILNNYRAMQRIRELRDERFTPSLVLELHRIVTEGTLDNPEAAGVLQANPDPADRVAVYGDGDQVLHRPPPVDQLPERLQTLCAFANSDIGPEWMPPVLRALTLHFMAGYDHYFEDGNGRTARALFYWSMLREGYWLTEFLSISTILKTAPGKYARSFLYSEQDGGDLTYFFIYHLEVIERALAELDNYLEAKAEEIKRTRARLSDASEFNTRQLAILDLAGRDRDATFSAQSHANSHAVSNEAARQDLHALEERGLLVRTKTGRKFVWRAAPDIDKKLSF